MARRNSIYLKQRFSDHTPLNIDDGFTLSVGRRVAARRAG